MFAVTFAAYLHVAKEIPYKDAAKHSIGRKLLYSIYAAAFKNSNMKDINLRNYISYSSLF